MDKKLILAVAGSGKTTLIVDKLNLEKRFLLITYTINNTKNLRESIIRKFGYIPSNISIYSYYNFLYSFCFRPFLGYKLRAKGIFWDFPPEHTNYLPIIKTARYMSPNRLLYHNRIAKLLEIGDVLQDINKRLEKHYDFLLIDEVQDFAGQDFNLLESMCKSNIKVLLVGDFYQHTFDTSRDGNTNNSLHRDYNKYLRRFEKIKVIPDTEHLNKSYRCTTSVCKFIKEQIGVEIESHKFNDSVVRYLDKQEEIEKIFNDNSIVKLFYREHYKYECYSRNWGDCKGENHYYDVCVVLNKSTMNKFIAKKLIDLPPVTKNKLYVACSRSNNNLYLIDEKNVQHLKE